MPARSPAGSVTIAFSLQRNSSFRPVPNRGRRFSEFEQQCLFKSYSARSRIYQRLTRRLQAPHFTTADLRQGKAQPTSRSTAPKRRPGSTAPDCRNPGWQWPGTSRPTSIKASRPPAEAGPVSKAGSSSPPLSFHLESEMRSDPGPKARNLPSRSGVHPPPTPQADSSLPAGNTLPPDAAQTHGARRSIPAGIFQLRHQIQPAPVGMERKMPRPPPGSEPVSRGWASWGKNSPSTQYHGTAGLSPKSATNGAAHPATAVGQGPFLASALGPALHAAKLVAVFQRIVMLPPASWNHKGRLAPRHMAHTGAGVS